MGVYAVKPWFRRRLTSTARALARQGATADQVTTVGVMASVAGGLAFAAGRLSRWAYLAVPGLALARTAANALDGLVAEQTATARPAGELWNETADRLGDAAFFAGAGTVPGVPGGLALAALAAAELSSYVGVAARAAGGSRRYEGPMGKPDRMLVLSVAALVAGRRRCRRPEIPLSAALCTVTAGAIATAAHRYRLASLELDARPELPAGAPQPPR